MTSAPTASATTRAVPKPVPDFTSRAYWAGTIKMSLSKFFILRVLHDGPMHGYDIARTVERITRGCCSPTEGTIYPVLRDFEAAFGLRHVIFRYFNVAGADPDGEVGEYHRPETHLIPLMLDAIDGKRDALTVFGTDYDTPDGTCVRDYVHVCDLVDAHVLGLRWLSGGKRSRVFNLGTGSGFSVREVIDQSRTVTNRAVPYKEGPRRPGDCTKLVSGSTRAKSELGWSPTRSTLDQMIADAWRWHQSGHYEK